MMFRAQQRRLVKIEKILRERQAQDARPMTHDEWVLRREDERRRRAEEIDSASAVDRHRDKAD